VVSWCFSAFLVIFGGWLLQIQSNDIFLLQIQSNLGSLLQIRSDISGRAQVDAGRPAAGFQYLDRERRPVISPF
jgi:hypothetical protein